MATETLRPNGVGTTTSGNIAIGDGAGAKWENVDEASADDGTTWLYGGAAALSYESFALGATAIGGSDTVNSVTVWWRTSGSTVTSPYTQGSGNSISRPFLYLGGNTEYGTQITNTVPWANHSEVIARPGGGAWAVSDLNSLEAGAGLGSPNSDFSALTQVYVVVDYTPAAAGPANLKTVNGLAKASVKTVNGLAMASIKTWDGLT